MRSPETNGLAPMPGQGGLGWTQAELRPAEFAALVSLVHESCGITMAPSKRMMLQTRLRKRLRETGLTDFKDYLALLRDRTGEERQAFVDSVVTNETSFFRERAHFSFLTRDRLERLAAANGTNHVALWSSSCSYGEEVYTTAMVAAAAAEGRDWRFSVLGTDISFSALKHACRAVYQADQIKAVPDAYQHCFLRSRDRGAAKVRIAPEIRQHTKFGHINLMHAAYRPGRMMDVIFCRNTLIYFDAETQQAILRRLYQHLRPGGYLILGHADVSPEKAAPLGLIGNNIYERKIADIS